MGAGRARPTRVACGADRSAWPAVSPRGIRLPAARARPDPSVRRPRRDPRPIERHTPVAQRDVRIVPDDQMVQQLDVEQAPGGHISAELAAHQVVSGIAVRLGRKLRWDPAKESFVDDAEAMQDVAKFARRVRKRLGA